MTATEKIQRIQEATKKAQEEIEAEKTEYRNQIQGMEDYLDEFPHGYSQQEYNRRATFFRMTRDNEILMIEQELQASINSIFEYAEETEEA